MTFRVTTEDGRELEDATSDDHAREVAARYADQSGKQAKITRIIDGESHGKPVAVGEDKDAEDGE